jgi:hypothetical protein
VERLAIKLADVPEPEFERAVRQPGMTIRHVVEGAIGPPKWPEAFDCAKELPDGEGYGSQGQEVGRQL